MDPGFQFHWLEQTLEKARDKHQTVNIYIIFLAKISRNTCMLRRLKTNRV